MPIVSRASLVADYKRAGVLQTTSTCPVDSKELLVMAVMLETSRGDLVIDLFTEDCPQTTKNFLKLCKYALTMQGTINSVQNCPRLSRLPACRIKYYNNVLFHNVQANFIVQTGDPTGTGKGGDSVYG